MGYFDSRRLIIIPRIDFPAITKHGPIADGQRHHGESGFEQIPAELDQSCDLVGSASLLCYSMAELDISIGGSILDR